MSFSRLHTVTSYSLLSSTVRVRSYVRQAKALGYQTLAVTDISVLHGVVEFYEAYQGAGIQPIIGLRLEYTPAEKEGHPESLSFVKSLKGYQQLMQLSSSKMTAEGPFYLAEHQSLLSDLFAVTLSAKGEVAQTFFKDEQQTAHVFQQLASYFDPQSLLVEHSFSMSQQRDPVLFSFYQREQLPGVALQEVRHLAREEDFAVTVLESIKKNDQLSITSQAPEIEGLDYLREAETTMEQMLQIAGAEVIQNTVRLTENCRVDVPLHQRLLPHSPVPDNQTAGSYLRTLCLKKLPERMLHLSEIYQKRLEEESTTVHNMGFDNYFLIV